MTAGQQLSLTKKVFVLSSERDVFGRHGQSYVGKVKYSRAISFFTVFQLSASKLFIRINRSKKMTTQ